MISGNRSAGRGGPTRATPACVLLLVLASSAPAAPYHASPEGVAGGDGSAARPWDLATALEAADTVRPGDTVLVAAGSHPENIRRGSVYARALGVRFINLVVHDLALGFGFWSDG